jgi:hypothetical protein
LSESYSFAQIDCGSYSFLLNKKQIIRTVMYESLKVLPTKYKGFFLYQTNLSTGFVLPTINLLQYWKQDQLETEAKCIFYILINDPKKQRIFKRLTNETVQSKIKEPIVGVILPNYFSFVNIHLSKFKLFPEHIRGQLYKRGLLGVIMSETKVLYWIDLEEMMYYIFKELSR